MSHYLLRECLGSKLTAFDYRVEADLLGVADARIKACERPALVEVGDVDDVTRLTQVVGKSGRPG